MEDLVSKQILEEIEDTRDIFRYFYEHKYCFKVPTVEVPHPTLGVIRRPRCPKHMAFTAFYCKTGEHCYVFTNSAYLLYRGYAELVWVNPYKNVKEVRKDGNKSKSGKEQGIY